MSDAAGRRESQSGLDFKLHPVCLGAVLCLSEAATLALEQTPCPRVCCLQHAANSLLPAACRKQPAASQLLPIYACSWCC